MRTHEKHVAIVLLALLSLLIFNFFRAFNYRFTSFDGFQYLAMSKSFWSMRLDYKLLYRSPLVSFFFVPNVLIARIEEIVFYLLSTYFFYLFLKKRLKMRKEALIALVLYAFCWWNIIFTLNTGTEYLAFLFIFLSFLLERPLFRGLAAGISFLIRPDSVVFLLPFFLFLEREKKEYLLGFVIISVGLELVLNLLLYKRIGLSYLDFFTFNFIRKMPWRLESHGIYWSSFLEKLLPYATLLVGISTLKGREKVRQFIFFTLFLTSIIGFLPATNDRIFFTKAVPLFSLIGSCFLTRNRLGWLVVAVFLLYNLVFLVKTTYPIWMGNVDCKQTKGVDVCSNLPGLLYLRCGVISRYASVPICKNPVFFNLPR